MTEKSDRRPSTLSKKVQIINELGLHARAAAIIAKKAQTATSTIWIVKENERADAASIIDLLILKCTKGSWITLTSKNPADHHVLLDILESVQSGFGE
jgi:phosphocarrier protein HPr